MKKYTEMKRLIEATVLLALVLWALFVSTWTVSALYSVLMSYSFINRCLLL